MKRTPQAETFMPYLRGKVPAITFITVAELHFGAIDDGWGEKRVGQLEKTIRKFTLLPWDSNLARVWGQLRSRAKGLGHPLHQACHSNDLWIAASSVYYEAPLLTGNRRHMCDLPGIVLADDQ